MEEEVKENASSDVALRPPLPEDEQFLYELYASTRVDELARVPWSEEQRAAFLKLQLRARDQSYRMYYPGIDDQVILFKERPVGRLIVVRADEEIRLVDIALLPAHRRAKIGTALIKGLMVEASNLNKSIRLQVEKSNPQAKKLYERLGFTTLGENSTHFQMEYSTGQAGI
jgi:ribosomal protein S18 acetylase RimI-like enzyme